MQSRHSRTPHAVNEAGKAISIDPLARPAPRRQNSVVMFLTKMLNAFGNFVSPIKEEKKRR